MLHGRRHQNVLGLSVGAEIRNEVTTGCLPVRGMANETPVVTTSCDPARFADQRWYIPG